MCKKLSVVGTLLVKKQSMHFCRRDARTQKVKQSYYFQMRFYSFTLGLG